MEEVEVADVVVEEVAEGAAVSEAARYTVGVDAAEDLLHLFRVADIANMACTPLRRLLRIDVGHRRVDSCLREVKKLDCGSSICKCVRDCETDTTRSSCDDGRLAD